VVGRLTPSQRIAVLDERLLDVVAPPGYDVLAPEPLLDER
jgi:hypothetical protein